MSEPTLAIVAPCYNEQEMLPTSIPVLLETLDRLIAANKISPASQLYFVDDGSRDTTWQQLIDACEQHPGRIVALRLSRNKGHQNALLAGLENTCEDMVVSIDADLQDDPINIDKMVDAYRAGSEVVYGVRAARDTDTKFKRMTAEGYYHVMRKLGVDLVFNHADFRLMSRRALNALLEYPESQLFLRGMVREVGFDSAIVEYDRQSRLAGESKYPLRKMLSLAWHGISSFSTAPLRAITLLGITASALSLLTLLWVLATRMFTDNAIPGWTSILLPLLFIGSVQLLSLGVIGEYLAKLYTEVKKRPRYHISERVSGTNQSNRRV
ncbi:glycosyltransferase family 2 protein [Gilvimarinus agarilyticus]|uniref:glycosyltransferase family 2 protein n=1 Tax=Gilvimarinus agarilyticus TaxID=679259 RepID=UPI0005A024DF|nr:glycosyltransferase family 2 protein [Gilvimarinus agarilyticus]